MKFVHHIIEAAASAYPDKIALVSQGQRHTYRHIDQRADGLAAALVRLGLKHQDRVVIFLENSVESVVALFAVLKAGGIFVIVNDRLKQAKLHYILKDTGARFLISTDHKQSLVSSAAADTDALNHIILVKGTRPGQVPPSYDRCASVQWHDWKDLTAAVRRSGRTIAPSGPMPIWSR